MPITTIRSGNGSGVTLLESWREDSAAIVNLLITDFGLRVSGTATAVVTMNLPLISTLADNQKFRIVDIGRSVGANGATTNPITLLPSGSDTIINDLNFVMNSNDMSLMLIANKTYDNWELH